MANKLPCEIVQDLLPSYMDGLTSDVTNEAVKEHVESCKNCKGCMEAMKMSVEFDEETEEKQEEKQEIEFLKTTQKRHRRILGISGVAVVIVLVCLLAFIRVYMIGNELDPKAVTCRVEVEQELDLYKVAMEGTETTLITISGAVLQDGTDISDISFTEKDGVVTIQFKGAMASPFHDNVFKESYRTEAEVTQIYVGDLLVWENGIQISQNVAEVYATKHPYIGEMPANNETANALGMSQVLGSYKNELQTVTEPYGWIFQMEEDIDSESHYYIKHKMEAFGYVLIAMIDNLNYVTYNYTVDGEAKSYTIDYDTAVTGRDLKTVIGSSASELQSFMWQQGLCEYPAVSEQIAEDVIRLGITNAAECEVYALEIEYYLDGEFIGGTGVSNADGSLIKQGETLYFELTEADLPMNKVTDISELEIQLFVQTDEPYLDATADPITIKADLGYSYTYALRGVFGDLYLDQ